VRRVQDLVAAVLPLWYDSGSVANPRPRQGTPTADERPLGPPRAQLSRSNKEVYNIAATASDLDVTLQLVRHLG
jgi:hypothetical protein